MARTVLAARAAFATQSLTTLYNPATRLPVLVRAVDCGYRPQPSGTELARPKLLSGLYQQLSALVLGAPK